MRTLEDHTLLYDKDCPMCCLYTGAFVQGGWLDADGRKPFGEVSECEYERLDLARASNEIALVNRRTGEITYGLDSLTRIVAHCMPFLKGILRHRAVRWPLQRFYCFISYNRKVIAAVKPTGKPCTPSFHLRYRFAYLLLAFLAASAVLSRCMALVFGGSPAWVGYAVMAGLLLSQAAAARRHNMQRRMDYLGNGMTVLLMGALAALLARQWLHLSPKFYGVFFLLVIAGMALEYRRRMRLLGRHPGA